MRYTVTFGHIPETEDHHHRLGRHIRHDSRSLSYVYRAGPGAGPVTVLHERRVPIFDQGDIGSCCGNAIIGACGCDPDYADMPSFPSLDEGEAVQLYSAAEIIDGGQGLPTEDNGTSGLSVCKAAKAAGLISGYQHALTLADALAALAGGPVITGVNWYTSFDTPASNGLIQLTPGATVRGGHEFVVRGCDPGAQTVYCDNSWGTGWGLNGSFLMGWQTWDQLLSEQGDVTVPIPAAQPAPVPTPAPLPPPAPTPPPLPPLPGPDPADFEFAKTARPWTSRPHYGLNKMMANATTAWLKARGLY